jgi:hypothetical protein
MRLPEMEVQIKSGRRMERFKRSALILLAIVLKVLHGEDLNSYSIFDSHVNAPPLNL